MYQIDNATASSTLPAPSSAGTAGYFTDGNPVTGMAPTVVPAEFLNMLMMELVNLVSTAGLTPSKADRTQVAAAVKALAQSYQAGVVGQARNLSMNVAAASTTATLTADEVVVGTALGGLRYCLGNFNQAINLATTGAGGMDTGSAPNSGYVALYAIYNPTSNTRALLGVNATSAAAPAIYGGANMPAGFTASALVSVVPTNSSGQIKKCWQAEREISFAPVTVLASGSATSYSSVSLAAAVPLNAKFYNGTGNTAPNIASNGSFFAADSSGTGQVAVVSAVANQQCAAPLIAMPIITPQATYYLNNVGSSATNITICGYRI